MGRRLVIALALLFIVIPVRAQPQARGAVDWILLVDTSKSMRGVGGTNDIFGDVKESLDTFVREAGIGDSVSIYSFDRDVQFRGSSDIRGDFDRKELFAIVHALQADGTRTHLGAAIARGLDRSEALLQRNDSTRERAIVLFTDGKEDVRGIKHPISIPSNVERVAKSHPWMFFISMGQREHEPQLDDFAANAAVRDRSKVLRARDRDAIRQAAADVRKLVEPPAAPRVPKRPATLRIAPSAIDFGKVESGSTSQERRLTIASDQPRHVDITLVRSAGVTMQPHENVAVAPDAPAHVALQLEIADGAKAMVDEVIVHVAAADGESGAVTAANAVANVTITKPSMLLRGVKWSIALAVLLAIALAALVLYSGRMPGELLSAITTRNALEGELEIVRPRTAPDAAFVGLPSRKANELALSSIVPLEALAGSDARLFCRRTRGEKKVWIAAAQGSLRVNDVEVPMAELYDADTIRVGDATLRFNHAGHLRPSSDPSFES